MNIKEPNKEYKTKRNLVYSSYHHVIFCPKYRRKCLVDKVEKRLKEILFQVSKKYNFEIIEIEVMPDHVHLILSTDPSFGVMKSIHRLKGVSSNILRKEFPHLLKMPCLWTRSNFISSVGSVSLEVVNNYITNQKGK